MGRAVALWRAKHGAKHAPTTQMSALRNIRMRSGEVAQRYCYCPRHYDNGIFVEIHTDLLSIQKFYYSGALIWITYRQRVYFWTYHYFTRNLPGFDNCGKDFTIQFCKFWRESFLER